MKIGVCIKQVPDTGARLTIDGEGRWINEEDASFVINESDRCAVEEALTLSETLGGEVVLFSLGPERVKDAIQKALAMGASRAVHLNDPSFAGGDAVSNGLALARAVERESLDLVLTGSQSDDLGYGATASVMAGHLGWPHAWLVMGIEILEGGKRARVIREMESGQNEIFQTELPAVLEVQEGINHPRYASLRGIMQAKKKEVAKIGAEELGLAPEAVGASGASLEILSVGFPEAGAGAEKLEGDPKTVTELLVKKLQTEARVL